MLEKTLNQVYDTNYTSLIQQGGQPVVDWSQVQEPDRRSRFDRFVDFFVKVRVKEKGVQQTSKRSTLSNKSLEEQLKAILAMPDEQYSDDVLTSELRKYITDLETEYVSVLKDYKMHIAPSYREVKPGWFQVTDVL